MIVQEIPQHGCIGKHRILCDAIVNIPHALLVLKCVEELVVHWVVECGSESTLITGNILGIAIEYFADGEDASRLGVLGPKLLRHLWRSVNSNAIKAVGGHGTVDPILEGGADEGVGLVQVREVGQTTHLNLNSYQTVIMYI